MSFASAALATAAPTATPPAPSQQHKKMYHKRRPHLGYLDGVGAGPSPAASNVGGEDVDFVAVAIAHRLPPGCSRIRSQDHTSLTTTTTSKLVVIEICDNRTHQISLDWSRARTLLPMTGERAQERNNRDARGVFAEAHPRVRLQPAEGHFRVAYIEMGNAIQRRSAAVT